MKTDNPNESTGQQPPEGDTESAAIAWALKYEKEYEKQYYVNTYDLRMAFRAGASYVESLTRWRDISKEGLPDKKVRVWVVFEEQHFGKIYPHAAVGYYEDEWRFDLTDKLMFRVTHWMPLPELPHL